jgi:protein-disulfide isomerase
MRRYVDTVLNTVTVLSLIVAAGVLSWRAYHIPFQSSEGQRPVQILSHLGVPLERATHIRGIGQLVLVEFSDFECPFCAKHATTTGQRIRTEFVNPGDVRHVFFHFPLPTHPRAQKASEAAECAGEQGRFWEMHERLFDSPASLDTDLPQHAEHLRLDRDAFAECLTSGRAAANVRRDMELARRLGVRSTPTFFMGLVENGDTINLSRRVDGAVPFTQFSTVFKELQLNLVADRRAP